MLQGNICCVSEPGSIQGTLAGSQESIDGHFLETECVGHDMTLKHKAQNFVIIQLWDLLIISAHIPSNSGTSHFLDFLDDLGPFEIYCECDVILCGDFNTKSSVQNWREHWRWLSVGKRLQRSRGSRRASVIFRLFFANINK